MISGAYNYYMNMYGNRTISRYDSHRRSDLKSTYNKMVSINRSAPLYKIDLSESTQRLAIDIKETAREINNISSELTDAINGNYAVHKKAYSDDEDTATAEYLGNGQASDEEHTVEVIKTADSQINTGNFMPPDSRYLNAGTYSFDLSIEGVTYEFQFNVGSDNTTTNVQNKINRLINNANIGISSRILTNGAGDNAIEITSNSTGSNDGEPIFTISDVNTSHSSGSVEFLGINHITQMPDNAIYEVDGERYESESNKVLYKNTYSLSLNRPGTAHIHLSDDEEVLSESLSSLISNYNKAIELSAATADKSAEATADRASGKGKNAGRTTGSTFNNGRLYNEFTRLARSYSDVLKRNGFELSDTGKISINTDTLTQATSTKGLHNTLEELNSFREDLRSKADLMYRNPMEYLNKKVVAYKNPHNNFPNPYSDSAYAGIMFDGYY